MTRRGVSWNTHINPGLCVTALVGGAVAGVTDNMGAAVSTLVRGDPAQGRMNWGARSESKGRTNCNQASYPRG